jgi:biotin carboxyl carrier protein
LTVRVEVGGRTLDLDVRRVNRGFEVTIGGRTSFVDLAAAPSGWSLIVDGASHEIGINEHAGTTTVYVDGHAVPVVLGSAGRFGRRAGGDAGAHGPKRITAPMPGRVVKVLVKPGDEVGPRQGLVVVEAMKMENELRAPAAGTVSEVRVAEGASVEANAVLIVIT